MRAIAKKHKTYWTNKKFLVSFIFSLIFLFVGLAATYFAIIYATEHSSYPVTDLILNNIPVMDVDGFFVYGPVVFWVLAGLYMIINKLEEVPFTLKAIALFLLIRSFFLTLTHIGPFPDHVQIVSSSPFWGVFTTGNDLFFSSHTGLPFLMALIFWKDKVLRMFSLTASVLFAIVVLLAHLHYSIDVFAAYFITYTIFHLSEKFFKKDRHFFISAA